MSKTVKRNYTKVPNSIVRNSRLLPNEKLVIIYVMGFDTCFASLGHMGRQIGISRSTVQRAMAKLVKTGLIQKTHAGGFMFHYRVDLTKLRSRPVSQRDHPPVSQ